MNKLIKKILYFFVIIFLVFFSVQSLFGNNTVEYSKFISELTENKIKEVTFNNQEIYVVKKNEDKYNTFLPINDPKLLNTLLDQDVKIIGNNTNKHNKIISIMISWIPAIFIISAWYFFIKQFQNNGKNIITFSKSKAKLLKPDQIKINFSDVAGCDEAKEEVKEIVNYLKNPNIFKKMGAKLTKGILMFGPPGTGKTLLAKAIAGEAKVSFLNISGSDFVEIFVGIGASRVRSMFDQAKKCAPCIIFIDEIDAVGKKRAVNIGGGNDEREQTLNQMLVEMDGFKNNNGIIIIAATNRPDILDPALLRPGRFDRQVYIGLPDIKGREEILKVHTRNILLANDVDLSIISRGTPGFSGADLSNLINEAILLTIRSNKENISMLEFEKSKDKIIMGIERNSLVMSEKQKEQIAFHESGHTIVGCMVPEHDPIHKVTIIPRGYALGVTFFLPESDILNESRKKLESKISTLYGGRIAEEIIFGKNNISTGAYNDIKIATSIARDMITKWGFSSKLGPILYSDENSDGVFLDKNEIKQKNISDATLYMIDQEIELIIKNNYNRTKKILIENIDILYSMKKALMKFETLNSKQIHDLMNHKDIT